MRLIMTIITLLTAACANDASTPSSVSAPSAPISFACTGEACGTIVSIGDSISLGYIKPLAEQLAASYSLYHPADNCRNSYYTSANIDQWLASMPQADVIIWNNGIWDSVWAGSLNTEHHPEWYNTTDQQYSANLTSTASKLLATGARVIFLTTTKLDARVSNNFNADRVTELNTIATSLLTSIGVEVIDLNATSQLLSRYDGIHYDYANSAVLASAIASAIEGN